MSTTLAGRAVVVTGASSGIGSALARELVSGGARVIAAARSAAALAELAAELGDALLPVATDVSDPEQVQRLAAAAGGVDAVVNNAGIGHIEPFLTSDPLHWRQTLDTNLIGALLVTRAFLPAMVAARRGVILNVGSASASGWPYLTLYAASKAALQAASLALDREHAAHGVHIDYVEIGPTAGTAFAALSDPAHLPLARQRWTELGIPWCTDVATPDVSARTIRQALERRLQG